MTIKTVCCASLAVLAIAGGAVDDAHADTYCVARPGCVGDWYGTDLQTALVLAQASLDEADVVKLGPGTFTRFGGFEYTADSHPENALALEGIEGKTTITTGQITSPGVGVLRLEGNGKDQTYAYGLRVEMPVDAQQLTSVGLRLEKASAEDVQITTTEAAGNGVFAGIELRGAAEVRRADVELAPGKHGSGVAITGAGAVMEDVRTAGGSHGVFVDDASGARIRRARIEAADGMLGILCEACTDLDVDNTVIQLAGDATGLKARAGAASVAAVDASHLTIVGAPPNDAIAVRAVTADMQGSSLVRLDNSVLHTVHWTLDAEGHASGTGSAKIVTRHSSFASGKEFTVNGGEVDSLDTVAPNPMFVDQGAGDLRPRFASALGDSGRSSGVFVSSVFDNALLKRLIDGDGDGMATPDIGAYEYRALPPVAKVTGPNEAAAGAPITLDGTASHGGDPGEGGGQLAVGAPGRHDREDADGHACARAGHPHRDSLGDRSDRQEVRLVPGDHRARTAAGRRGPRAR
jgi:hypothetical protein